MNNFQLYIEDELADIGAATKIYLNRTFLDMSDMSARGLLFSNILTLPASHRNERIFGFPTHGKAGGQSFVLLFSHQVIGSGVIDVLSLNRQNGIKIQLLLGGGFWRAAGDLMLNDLVLDDYDFKFSDLKDVGFSNRIFGMGGVSQLTTGGGFSNRTFSRGGVSQSTTETFEKYFTPRPTYAFKPLIDLISERLGYSIDYGYTLEKTDIRQTGCISNAKDLLVSDYKLKFLDIEISSFGYLNFEDGEEMYKAGDTVIYDVRQYLTTTMYNKGFFKSLKIPKIPVYLIIKGFITPPIIGGELVVRGENADPEKPEGYDFEDFLTVAISKKPRFYNLISVEIDTTKWEFLKIKFPEGTILNDVTISTAYKESSIFKYRETISKKEEAYLKVNPEANIDPPEEGYALKGYYTDISDFYVLSDYNLPNLTCKDFLKEIIKMNFLSFDINENKKEIKITPLSKNIDTNNSVDLSNRIEDLKTTYAKPKYFASKNTLSYNNDKDVKEIGNYDFLGDNIKGETKEFLKVESFSASKNYKRYASFFIYDIKNNTRKELTDRVVYTEGVDVYFEPLSMENIYTKYYKKLVENMGIECTLNINLDFNHFRQLAESPLFYVSWLAQHFLVLSIEGFDGVGLCKVKCIKYG